jgi:transcriptional regulator with XRE-family HTH domain
MFMASILYENVYLSNANVLDEINNQTYIDRMTILRKNLKKEMDSRGWNATALSEKSGVPQPTIQRFLSGTHGDPRSSTIQKLAKGLGVTEATLRGFEEADIPVPLYESIEKLNEENRFLITQMVNKILQAQENKPEETQNKPLTLPTENVGGGLKPTTSLSYSNNGKVRTDGS